MKYSFSIVLFLTLTGTACKNRNGRLEPVVSAVDINPAYKNLNDSIGKFPGNALLYLRRAVRLSRENAHELAYEDYLKAWSLQPGLEVALPFSANLQILGRRSEKLKLLESLQREFPTNIQVERLLAESYEASGMPGQALNIYNEMIIRDSLDPETQYEKGILLEQMRDTIQAIAALKKAYTINGIATYGLELANLYAEQRNPLALEICDFIIRQDVEGFLIDPFFIKGIYYSNIKQYAKAISQFDSCITRDWKTTDAYLEKGQVYYHMKRFDAAIQTLKMATTVSPSDPDAYFWLGRSYEAEQKTSDAIDNYDKAISLDKNFTEARKRLENLNHEFAHPSH